MFVKEINEPLFRLPASHPARRFLEAFIDCLEECRGRHLPYPGNDPVEQEWYSQLDGKQQTFSDFVYAYLSFDIELDGWLTNAPALTDSERGFLNGQHYLRSLMAECRQAAEADHNEAILPLITQVENLFDLWEACIRSRLPTTR